MQLRLLEFFVLEVTARSAADILGIQPNSAALFYRKIREVIAYHLEQESHCQRQLNFDPLSYLK